MRKYLFILSFFLYSTGNAQDCPDNYLGTKTLYPVPKRPATFTPEGYEAVFINHVGRHGARHLTKDVAASSAWHLLKTADSLHSLTGEGKRLLLMVDRLQKVEKNDFESISLEGKSEQQGLAKRMMANYPGIFSNPLLQVTVAKKIRTSQSADAFLSGLKDKVNTEGIKKTVNDTLLRFYDLSPSYTSFEKEGAWKEDLEKFKKLNGFYQLTSQLGQRFFSGAFLKQIGEENMAGFVDDIYGFATIINSIQAEISRAGYRPADLNFTSFFTCKQLQRLNQTGDAEDFLLKGPGSDLSGIQVKIAAPLLMNFIATTDEYISTKKPSAQLRFSHAETIAPFAALLGIHGAATPAKNLKDVSRVWVASAIIPLSANIQWILYKKPASDDYVIRFLLNEKEVSIDGLPTKTFPYYKWPEVRSFYINKLKVLNLSMADNGFKYLQAVNN